VHPKGQDGHDNDNDNAMMTMMIARRINFMAEFPLELKHIAGKKNRADPLSRRPDYDDGLKYNEEVVVLPESLFIKAIETTGLNQIIAKLQE